jgi:hypothetical protein
LLGRAGHGKEMLRSIWNGSRIRLFKESITESTLVRPLERVPATDMQVDGSELSRKSTVFRLSMIRDIAASKPWQYFGKSVLFKDNKPAHLPAMLFSGRGFVQFGGSYYEIYPERPKASIVLSFLALLLAAPLAFKICIFLLLRGYAVMKMQGIDSMGYGLDNQQAL